MTITTPFDAAGWIDVSVPLQPGVPTFPGDPNYNIALAIAIADGAICNVSRLDMGAHTGTHLDAPSHFIQGAAGTESIPLDVCVGPAWVVDATALSGNIGPTELGRLDIPSDETRLLFKTPNSELWNQPGFSEAFIGLDGQAARALAKGGVRLVGADYLSIAPFGNPGPTHLALLSAGVAILEGLDLRAVEPGPVDLLCLPLRLVGSDGVPARALIRPRSTSKT